MPTRPRVATALGWQLVLRLGDNRAIAPSRAARRALARAIAALGNEFGVFAWCVADNHLHVAAFCAHESARELARRLAIALQRRLEPGVAFERPRLTPINDQAHARALLTYVIGQSAHHGASQDDAHEGNCVHDLVGTRTLMPWLPERVREHFPRVTRAHLLAPLGVEGFDERRGLDADAAAAAFALPSLRGRAAEVVDARRALVAVAGDFEAAQVATALNISPRSVWRLAKVPPPEAHARAVRRQLGLRAALAARPLTVGESPAATYMP